jgi:hypothetical protein
MQSRNAAMSNPYEMLPPSAFWRLAVGQRNPLEIENIWAPKWFLSKEEKVATAGSCFAQHFGPALIDAGYSWYNAEPAPEILPEAVKRSFNYGIFSFRTGNIYTAELLLQWLLWAFGNVTTPNEVWKSNDRFYDPFRPNIEPGGFASASELIASRERTLNAIRRAVIDCSLFVFTLGLTEAWINKASRYVYPICPGTVAGTFDAAEHEFQNYRYEDVRRQLHSALDLMHSLNPGLRFLLTVSPVPLAATASSQHVLVATTQSKSTLRAVAGDLADERLDTDYFPSFELVSSFPFKGMFYENNMRTVSRDGIDFVMRSFFAAMKAADQRTTNKSPRPVTATSAAENHPRSAASLAEDVVCEEILLDAFAKNVR